MKLSATQLVALDSFAHPGGHGFGENAGITRATAYALARMGLIVIGSYYDHRSNNSRCVAYATQAGVDALNAAGQVAGVHARFYGATYVAFGWAAWNTIPATKRGGEAVAQTATLGLTKTP